VAHAPAPGMTSHVNSAKYPTAVLLSNLFQAMGHFTSFPVGDCSALAAVESSQKIGSAKF